MTTVDKLREIFGDNFVAYFRSHIAHLNIMGRTFQEDHEFLGEVYADLQGQIDTIGELIRTFAELVDDSIDAVVETSSVLPLPIAGSADVLLGEVKTDLETLRSSYRELIDIADAEHELHISNYAQDRVLALSKFIWMLDSTLESV